MTGRLNSADRVVSHAIGALVSGYHRPLDEVAMMVDTVRIALPHTSDSVTAMHNMITVAVRLIEMPNAWHDHSGGWAAWRMVAQQAVIGFHRYELGCAQERMQDALKQRAA